MQSDVGTLFGDCYSLLRDVVRTSAVLRQPVRQESTKLRFFFHLSQGGHSRMLIVEQVVLEICQPVIHDGKQGRVVEGTVISLLIEFLERRGAHGFRFRRFTGVEDTLMAMLSTV